MFLQFAQMATISLWDLLMALDIGDSAEWLPILFCHLVLQLFLEGRCLLLPEGFFHPLFQPKHTQKYMCFKFSFRFLLSRGQSFSVKVNSVAWEQPKGPLHICRFKTVLGNRGCSSTNTSSVEIRTVPIRTLSSELTSYFCSVRIFFSRIPQQFKLQICK